MLIRAILFDKDGTLFDFQRSWAPWVAGMIDRLSAGDAALAGALAEAWGFDRARKRIRAGSIIVAGDVPQVAAAALPLLAPMRKAALIALLEETAAGVAAVEQLPLAGLLDRLARSGVRCGVATNDSEKVARAQLARAGVAGRFDFIAGHDSGFGSKPGPGMCLAFAARLGLTPESIAMVGDSPHDMRAGRAAGMRTVAVLSGPAGAEVLAPHADAVLPDIGSLPDWLSGQAGLPGAAAPAGGGAPG